MGLFSGIGDALKGGAELFTGAQAKKDAKRAGKDQAKVERRVTGEKLRQIGRDREQNLGGLNTSLASSGVWLGGQGTADALRRDMEREFSLTQQFTSEVGASAAKAAEHQGKMAGDQIQRGAIMDGIGLATKIFGML